MSYLAGAPFFGAELHNSSASTPETMADAFTRVHRFGADLVFAPVTWDTLEPEEGVFDFTLVDQALSLAGELGLHWVPLWFGAWKNGMSSYVPSWVKRDSGRFPRAELAGGSIEHVSPFGPEIRDADGAAFEALVTHLAQHRASELIPMVQVENEMGLLGGARDLSAPANERWNSPVPKDLVATATAEPGRLREAWRRAGGRSEGTWTEIFGSEADEAFMAAAYASHTETLIRRGVSAFDRPYFVNAWLDSVGADPATTVAGGTVPGQYPSGGPLPHLFPIWRHLAPSISFFSPDIYLGDIDRVCAAFTSDAKPLVIPEMRRDPVGIGHMFRAVGSHRASVVSPFGLDSLLPGTPGHDEFVDAYGLLDAIRGDLRVSADEDVAGFFLEADRPVDRFTFDGIELTARLHDPHGILGEGETGHGIIIRTAPDTFRVVGRGFTLAVTGSGSHVGLDAVHEKNLAFETTRILGGDETGGGNLLRFFRLGASGTGIVPFDTRFTGAIDFTVYRYGQRG